MDTLLFSCYEKYFQERMTLNLQVEEAFFRKKLISVRNLQIEEIFFAKFHQDWRTSIFGSFLPQNGPKTPNFGVILENLAKNESRIRNLQVQKVLFAKFHQDWRTLIFGSFLPQNGPKNP